MVSVLVTGAGGGVGQGIIKSLKMIDGLDVKIIAADMSELATGLYAADHACLVERCTSPAYMESLQRVFDRYSVDFYFPGTDVELLFCAENKARIRDEFGVETVISSPGTIEIADDKLKTASFLQNEKFAHPKTFRLSDYVTGELDFPVIVKPAVGCRSIGVYKVDSEEAIQPHLENPEGLVIQECVGNDDQEYTCTVVKVENELSPVLVLQRSLRSGDTYRANPIKSELIENYVQQVAARLDIDGGCNFQLRLDDSGNPKIFEINSRFSGTTPFCSQLGFNPVEYYLKKKLGQTPNVDIDYDAYVLRYWSEVVVSKSQLSELAENKDIAPKLSRQFRLFD